MPVALCEYIGQFSHVHIDDIVIWSNNLEESQKHIHLIMHASPTLFMSVPESKNVNSSSLNYISLATISPPTELHHSLLNVKDYEMAYTSMSHIH